MSKRADVRTLAGADQRSNFRLPLALGAVLRRVLVISDMHRVHHSSDYREFNSNYGLYLSLWDYLFGSCVVQPAVGHLQMQIGLSYFREKGEARLAGLLTQPFREPTRL